MEEKELSLKCTEGDKGAQKILYERYSGYLLGICVRYASDRQEALDILHDTFIKIYANIGKFTYRGEGSLKGWLARLTVNLALERLRAGSRFHKVEIQGDMAEEVPPENFHENIPTSVLVRFIEELPPGYRAVFNLYVFEEMSHKEIARMLGINEKSSSSQFLRAKQAIAKKINKYLKDTEKWEA